MSQKIIESARLRRADEAPTTAAQWERASRLASRHYHGWGGWALYGAHGLPVPRPATWEEARARWAIYDAESQIAGLVPSPVHTTGTGRLSWVVEPSGRVLLGVRRAGPRRARMHNLMVPAPRPSWERAEDWDVTMRMLDGTSFPVIEAEVSRSGRARITYWDGPCVHDEHRDALDRAVMAVTTPDEVLEMWVAHNSRVAGGDAHRDRDGAVM